MRSQIITCNVCKKTIDPNKAVGCFSLTVFSMESGKNDSFELCEECAPANLGEPIRATLGDAAEAPAPKPPKEPKPKR
jgi:hypothetical protein